MALDAETISSSDTETKVEPESSPDPRQKIPEAPPIDSIQNNPYIPLNPIIINQIPIDMADKSFERTLREMIETNVTQTLIIINYPIFDGGW